MKHATTPLTVLLTTTLLLVQTGQATAQLFPFSSRTSEGLLKAFREVVAGPSESVVRIFCDNREAAIGTVVEADGWIITKASLLKGKVVCQFKDGRRYVARITGVEPTNDLALLQVERVGLKPIVWRPARTAEPGEWLASVGPQDLPVAVGVVSVAVRKPNRLENGPSAPPANSGYLGIQLRGDSEGRPIIEVVTPKSAAERAGLQVGDVVLSVAGRKIESTEKLIEVIQSFRAGESISLRIRRGEEVRSVRATLDKRPANQTSRGERMNAMGSELSVKRTGFPLILQHDTVVKPIDCGSPVIDLDGKAIGINIARAGRTESYAIPSETIVGLLSELKSGKLAPKEEVDESALADLQSELKSAEQELANATRDLEKALDEGNAVEVSRLRKKVDAQRAKVEELRLSLDKLRKDSTKP
jgi:serine protease Do